MCFLFYVRCILALIHQFGGKVTKNNTNMQIFPIFFRIFNSFLYLCTQFYEKYMPIMKKILVFSLLSVALLGLASCGHKPTKVELLRAEKQRNDSIEMVRNEMTRQSADSLLQALLPEVEPLMKPFRYEKNDSYEDHGHYIHRLLVTGSNTSRNYLQALVSDDRQLILRSFVYAARPVNQTTLKLTADELYVEAQGSNHVFEAEGTHEIMSLFGDDALRVLAFVSANHDSRIRVQAASSIVYYLTNDEKQALADTYELALMMKQIYDLEQTISLCNRKAERYQMRLNSAKTDENKPIQ